MSPPSKRPRLTEAKLLTLPEEVLSTIITSLSPKSAFYLALTNTRLLNIFEKSFDTIDAITPFQTNTIYTPIHIHSLLRHTKNLSSLKINTPLLHLPNPLPLKTLSFNDSVTLFRGLINIPTLTELHIDSPLLDTPKKLSNILPNLISLEITNIDTESTLLHDIQSLLRTYGNTLKQLSLTIAEESVDGITDFIHVINSLKQLPNINSLSLGANTPETVSRSPDDDSFSTFITTLPNIRSAIARRPLRTGRNTNNVHLFTTAFEPDLLQAVLPLASDGQLILSFAANSLLLPAGETHFFTINELATHPSMYTLPHIAGINLAITSFNIVLRQLATSYKPAEKMLLSQLITPTLQTLRVQVPFRSETNLTSIAQNIFHTMSLSNNIQELHITREIVYFILQDSITPLLTTWKSLKRLYLTAPENFVQDPYPERRCVKYSAWRLVVSLPNFLQRLPTICPRLETLLLEEIGCMGEVENPVAMSTLISWALNAVESLESVLPGVDAGTLRGQLLMWRSQFL